MPTYDFRCPKGHNFERFFGRISEAPSEVACPECGELATRQISGGAGLIFKGSGFYITDYGKDGKKDQRASAASKSGDSKSGDSGSGDSKSGDSKSGDSRSGDSKSGDKQAGGSGGGEGKGSSDGGGNSSKSGGGKGGESSSGGSDGGTSSGKSPTKPASPGPKASE